MPTKTQKKYVPGSLGKYFAMFVAPALIVYLVFSIVPFLFTIYYSFTDYTDMEPRKSALYGSCKLHKSPWFPADAHSY